MTKWDGIIGELDQICEFLWSSGHNRSLFYAVLELQEWYLELALRSRGII